MVTKSMQAGWKMHTTNLMNYANRLEETQPSHARTLKAELHKRAVELSLTDVEGKAEMVHDGTTQYHQKVLKIKEMVAQLASEVNDTAKTTKATVALSGALQTSVADAKAKTAAAGDQAVSSASSSGAALEKANAIKEQFAHDNQNLATVVLKQDREQEVTNLQVDILEDLVEDSKDEVLQQDVKIEVLEERLKMNNIEFRGEFHDYEGRWNQPLPTRAEVERQWYDQKNGYILEVKKKKGKAGFKLKTELKLSLIHI